MRYSARFLLAVKKKPFKCARAMARIVNYFGMTCHVLLRVIALKVEIGTI